MEPMTRRVLASTLLTYLLGRSALAQVSLNKDSGTGRALVTIFLRGAMDGLSMIAPVGDDDYHRHRKALGIGSSGLKLTDFFAFHPAMAPLHPFFMEGKLTGIHAIGSQDQSRSHFEAMALMERGAAGSPAEISSGWVARWLDATRPENASPLRGIGFGPIQPDILRGATDVSTIQDLGELRLALPGAAPTDLRQRLVQSYATGSDPMSKAGKEMFKVLETLERLDPKGYKAANGAVYPTSHLGNGLKQTALLIKANVGLEVACLDQTGWDTHVAQGATVGILAENFKDLSGSLAAFAKDLGPHLDTTTVVVMTEFGRRVPENSGLGTDHGRASAWMVLGGGVQGGKVFAQWPGLKEAQLEGPGDLKVTTDYRNALIEILSKHGPDTAALKTFPNAQPAPIGLFT